MNINRWFVVSFLILSACIPSPKPQLVPLDPVEPSAIQWQTEMPSLLAKADGVIVGKITSLEEDWVYDDPCGLIMILRKACDGTATFKVHIENTVHDKWLWAFTPTYGSFGLFVGEQAVFIWNTVVAYRYFECRARQGMGGYCNYDMLPALTSDLNVLPLVDSSRVDSLFHAQPK